MGLFSWLFGGSRKGAHADSNAMKNSGEWYRASSGNLTKQVEQDQWVTVFKGSDGWAFSAPYPKEVRDSDKPYFSPPFATEAQAKDCAEAYIDDRRYPHEDLQTKRERERPAKTREILPSIVEAQREKITALEEAAQRQAAAKNRKMTTLQNLQKKIEKRAAALQHLASQCDEARLKTERASALEMASQANAILHRVNLMISELPKAEAE